jgi:hypothetical protein
MLKQGSTSAPLALVSLNPDLSLLAERLVAGASSNRNAPVFRHACLQALQVLGPRAAPFATQIAELLEHPPRWPDGAPSFVTRSYDWEPDVLTALEKISPPATNVIPVLKPYLTNNTAVLRLLAARAILRIESDPEALLPCLTNLFEERAVGEFAFAWGVGFPDPLTHRRLSGNWTNFQQITTLNTWTAAAYLLGELGPAAKAALPSLEGLTGIVGTPEHLFASWAIVKISGTESAFARHLVAELDAPGKLSRGDIEFPAAHFLGDFGATAEFAIPRLETLARENPEPLRTVASDAVRKIRAALHKRDHGLNLKKIELSQ